MEKKTNDPRLQKFMPTAEIIARNRGDREIVFYGDSDVLRELLQKYYGINSRLVASTHIREKNGCHVPLKTLKGMQDKYYIVVPFLQPQNNYKSLLRSLGYNEFSDFVFTLHERIDSSKGFSDYSDEYGNHIDAPKGVRIVLESSVGNSIVKIDKTASFIGSTKIRVWDPFVEVSIGAGSHFAPNSNIAARANSKITIGEGCTFGESLFIRSCVGSVVSIGNDCMFSLDVNIYCGDGHVVFDVETGERTLDIINSNSKNSTIIDAHVWIGLNAMILGNTSIGRSSIVGAGSVVKGKFPNNCAVAGNPAKVVRKNITWSRNNYATDINCCGEENIAFTEE